MGGLAKLFMSGCQNFWGGSDMAKYLEYVITKNFYDYRSQKMGDGIVFW